VGHIEAPGLVQPVGWLDPFAIDTRDLLRVAMAVFQADGCPRGYFRARESWIVISLGLETSIWWSSWRTRPVGRLSPISWQSFYGFSRTTRGTSASGVQAVGRRISESLFPEPVPDGAELALFSGGLDSMAGLWARNRQEKRTFVAVSVSGNRIRRDVQRCSVESLQELGADVRWVVLQQHLAGGKKPENSQRTRGFLFYCVGEAVSSTLRLASVNTYESGPGAINLPMNEAQVGAQNTRANHPGTLLRLDSYSARH